MSKDYSHLGLGHDLRSVNSLKSTGESSYQFDSRTEEGAIRNIHIQDASINNAKLGTAVIGTAQIGTLSFNEISGGTATLGGTNDGDGVLRVKDQSGSQIVKLNNSGVEITSGTTEVGQIKFVRSDDSDKFVEMTLVPGGGSPFDFAIDKSSALNLGDFYIGNARRWSSFTVNVDLSAELLGGGTSGGTSVRFSVGNGTMTVKFGGTTMMSMNSAGDLKIRGELGTGITSF